MSELMEMGKIVAQIESESGLKAFQSYMDLQWSKFYYGIFCDVAGTTFILAFFGLIIYAVCKCNDKSDKEKK
jgi:uncharacterized membrane protein